MIILEESFDLRRSPTLENFLPGRCHKFCGEWIRKWMSFHSDQETNNGDSWDKNEDVDGGR